VNTQNRLENVAPTCSAATEPTSSRGPSVTAAVVAATLLLLRGDAELGHLIDETALRPLELAIRATVPLLGLAIDHVPWPLLRRSALVIERLLSPGFVAHYALRKSAVRTELLRAIADGHRQVVLLGAGFDMLGSSLPDGARIFEVDHPATQAAKRHALRGVVSRAVTFVAVDLAVSDLQDALLAAPGFDRAADTVFVAEGLLMYLSPSRVGALLQALVENGSRRTRAVLTVITPDAAGRFRLHTQRHAVDVSMRWLDEPFVWGAPRSALEPLLREHGLHVRRIVSTFELREALLEQPARRRLPRPTGELVVVADGTSAQ